MQYPFATPEDLAPLQDLLRQVLAQQQAAARPADDYLSIDQVAALAKTTRKTVGKWISEGKYGADGRRIHLFTLEFQPGFRRVPHSALVAYGQGLAYDATQLDLAPAAAPPRALDSKKALRKAA